MTKTSAGQFEDSGQGSHEGRDDFARRARSLVRTGRHAALASLDPESGAPLASRILIATDFTGRPFGSVSGLSRHTAALRSDPRASLMIAADGRGDPMAQTRITVSARAETIDPDHRDRGSLRRRLLARHPYAKRYIDLPDFRFVRFEPTSASLIAGFGSAHAVAPDHLIDGKADDLEATEARALDHMNADHADAIGAIAVARGLPDRDWSIVTMDRLGFELADEDRLERIEFLKDAAGEGGYRKAFVDLYRALAEPTTKS